MLAQLTCSDRAVPGRACMSSSSSTPRPRPHRSCITCSRRKVGCDRARPICGRCSRAGLPCSYGSDRPSNMPIRFVDETPNLSSSTEGHVSRRASSSQSIHASLPQRIERLDQLIHSMSEDQNLMPDPEMPPIGISNPGHMYLGGESRTRYVSPAFFALISQEIAEINDLLQRQQPVAYEGLSPSDAYNAESEAFSLISPSLSENLSSSSQKQRLNRQHLYGDIFQEIPAWFGPEQHYSTSFYQLTTINELVSLTPSWQCCDVLVWAYLRGFHAIVPMLHAGTFLTEYIEFREWRTSGRSGYEFSSHWFALFSAVLFAGSVVCPVARLREVYGPIQREVISSRLYEFAITAIRLSNFPHDPSVQTLSAFIIVDSIWLREEQALNCCAFIGLALRVAQMLGLHKEPSNFAGISIIDAEVRRRVWWQLLHCDTAVAVASGLIPLIHPTMWDVRPISELPDRSLAQLSSGQSVTHIDQRKSILGILAGGRLNFSVRVNVLIRILNSSQLTTADVENSLAIVAQIQQDLAERIDRIIEIEALIPVTQPDLNTGLPSAALIDFSESNPRLARWSRSILSLLSMKPHPTLYGPFRRAGFLPYYLQRVPDAMSYNKRFLYGFLTLCQTPDFQPFHWSWPGQHQPLHAIMAILQDLEDNPRHPTADETRKLIDLAVLMSSSGPDGKFGTYDPATSTSEPTGLSGRGPTLSGGISAEDHEGRVVLRPLTDGGNEAWEFVRKLRERVWRKAGIDPTFLRCPSRASEIDLELAISGVSAAGAESDYRRGSRPPQSDDSDSSDNYGVRRRQASGRMTGMNPTGAYGSASTASGSVQPSGHMSPAIGEHWTFDQHGGFYPVQQQQQQDPRAFGAPAAPHGADVSADDTLLYGAFPETDDDWAQFANSLEPFSSERRPREP